MDAASMGGWTPPTWFVEVNRKAFGEEASQFIAVLPETVAHLSTRWDMKIRSPYDGILQNFVAQVERGNGAEAVFKISADKQLIHRQIDTLERFGGNGAVKLLEADPDRGALLMERADPGVQLRSSFDDETSVLIETFRRLWHAENQTRTATIPTLSYLGIAWIPGEIAGARQALYASGLEEQVKIVDEAEGLLEDMLSSSKEEILLHGDLQANHILSARREKWLSIDPLGIFGERAFDIAALFRDDTASLRREADPERSLAQRMRRLADELDLDWERVRGWGLVQAVYARNWRFKVGLPSPDWSLTTKYLAAARVRLFLGLCCPLMAFERFGTVVAI